MLRTAGCIAILLVATLGPAEARRLRFGFGHAAGITTVPGAKARAEEARRTGTPPPGDGRFASKPAEEARPPLRLSTAEARPAWCGSNVTAGGFCIVN